MIVERGRGFKRLKALMTTGMQSTEILKKRDRKRKLSTKSALVYEQHQTSRQCMAGLSIILSMKENCF
jgi:hypothetical protein